MYRSYRVLGGGGASYGILRYQYYDGLGGEQRREKEKRKKIVFGNIPQQTL